MALNTSFHSGYRWTNVQWSIAGDLNGKAPNILSELQWKNTGGPYINFGLAWNFWKQLELHATFTETFIISGTATDTDFTGDNRTYPSYNSELNSNDGSLMATGSAIAYKFSLHDNFSVTPSIGYGRNSQSLHLTDKYPSANSVQLNSSYKMIWNGPCVGVSPSITFSKKLQMLATAIYHQVQYNASANWNLIEAFQHPVSFRHRAKGFGVETEIKLHIRLRPFLSLAAVFDYAHWETGYGIDELFLSTGEIQKTRFNGAFRNQFGAGLGIHYLLHTNPKIFKQ
jgi:hypothetical protein